MATKRKSLSKRTRFEVFKRDGFKCAYCGRTPPDVLLHVDHVEAVANGGSDDPTNLITACADCNLGKAAVPLTAVAESLERQAEEAQERAEQIRAYAEAMRAARDAQDDTVGIFADAWFERFDPSSGLRWAWPPDRAPSIKRFVSMLPFPEILDAIEITAAAGTRKRDLAVKVEKMEGGTFLSDANAFRYFCGVCWKKIRDREEKGAA
jgi:hypothetical protein